MTTQEYLDSWKTKEDMILCPVIDALNVLIDVFNERNRLINLLRNVAAAALDPCGNNMDIYGCLYTLNHAVTSLVNLCVDYSVNNGDFTGLESIPRLHLDFDDVSNHRLDPYIDIVWDLLQKLKKVRYYSLPYLYQVVHGTGETMDQYRKNVYFVEYARKLSDLNTFLNNIKNRVPESGYMGITGGWNLLSHFINIYPDGGTWENDDYCFSCRISWYDCNIKKNMPFEADYYYSYYHSYPPSDYGNDPVYIADSRLHKFYFTSKDDSRINFRLGYDNQKDFGELITLPYDSFTSGFQYPTAKSFETVFHLDSMCTYKI